MFFSVFELVVKETVFYLWLPTGPGFIPETFGLPVFAEMPR
jgi:hypothetical protein